MHLRRHGMAAVRLALLLAVGLGALAAGAAEECKDWQLQCPSGSCIDANKKCDGHDECGDGWDERQCDTAASLRLPVNNTVTARAEYKQEYNAVYFSLCNASLCSTLMLAGHSPDGSLWYKPGTECDPTGRDCSSWGDFVVPHGHRVFNPGNVSFVVKNGPSRMSVWLLGYRDMAASVAVPDGADLLRVTPLQWTSDMAVHFGAVGKCIEMELQCPSGRCIDAYKKCDGYDDCGGGSDERQCDTAASLRLPVNSTVTARAEYKEVYRAVHLSLCNASRCSKLLLAGHSPDGSLLYEPGTECDPTGKHCSSVGDMVWPDGSIEFTPGNVSVVVEHGPSNMSVWLPGHPDKAASVAVPHGADLLRVIPWFWTSDMPVHFGRQGASRPRQHAAQST